jgi:hypothetical protein
MPIVHLLGIVLPPPPWVSITSKDMPKVSYSPLPGLDITITINISNSAIDMECNLSRFIEGDIVHVHRITLDIARAVVNLIAFVKGFGLSVYMHTLITPDGTPTVLVTHDPQLAEACTVFLLKEEKTPENDFQTIASLVISEPSLFIALDDLVVSQTVPHSVPVNCARVVDAIRHMIAPVMSGKRDHSWEAMRTALKLERSYLQMITDNSTAGRHGDRSFISGPITMEIQRRAWTVMNRFLEFRKRKNQPLPVEEFPMLS